MDGLMTNKEIIETLIDRYELGGGGIGDESTFQSTRQALTRARKRLDISKDCVKRKNPETGHKCSYYSPAHLERLERDPKFHDYLIASSSNPAISSGRRSREIAEEIESRRDRHIEYLGARTQEDYLGPEPVSRKEFNENKASMMLTALFNIYFEGFDDDKLLEDLNTVLYEDELGLTPEQIMAEERLSNPEGHYFRRRARAAD